MPWALFQRRMASCAPPVARKMTHVLRRKKRKFECTKMINTSVRMCGDVNEVRLSGLVLSYLSHQTFWAIIKFGKKNQKKIWFRFYKDFVC